MENQTQSPYLKACALLGETPRPVLADRTKNDMVSEDGFHRLTICIRAKNMIDGKVLPRKYDGSQWYYVPRFKPNNAGSGFAFTDCDDWAAGTHVGERLEYRTYELMREGVEEFAEYYNDFHTPYVAVV